MINGIVVDRVEPVGNYQTRVILRNERGESFAILFGDSISTKSMIFRALLLAPTKFKRGNKRND
ncbi:hypothetical protein AK95_07760 [Paenibacillus sp. LC231]|nr:hypothetical protein AK95_07760 [Paenibacillus sp. LC231]